MKRHINYESNKAERDQSLMIGLYPLRYECKQCGTGHLNSGPGLCRRCGFDMPDIDDFDADDSGAQSHVIEQETV